MKAGTWEPSTVLRELTISSDGAGGNPAVDTKNHQREAATRGGVTVRDESQRHAWIRGKNRMPDERLCTNLHRKPRKGEKVRSGRRGRTEEKNLPIEYSNQRSARPKQTNSFREGLGGAAAEPLDGPALFPKGRRLKSRTPAVNQQPRQAIR